MTWEQTLMIGQAVGLVYTAFNVFFKVKIDLEVLKADHRTFQASVTDAWTRGFSTLESRIEQLIEDVRELRGRK